MLKKTKKKHFLTLALFSCMLSLGTRAQFSMSGQLRTRTELRNGLGNLVPIGSKPAAFTSQRTRLVIGYHWDRLRFGVSVQDIRVWGQDASTISNADGNKLMLHEAWADLVLANKTDTSIKFRWVDQMSLKIGRQELVYDDSRLIGNLDWLQQARRHDMALLKTLHKGWQVDIGFAFNQNSDGFGITGTGYIPANIPAFVKNSLGNLVQTPAGLLPLAGAGNANNASLKTGTPVWLNPPTTNGGNQDYKTFASIYLSKKIGATKFSGLFFNDNFGKYKMDSSGTAASGYVYGRRFVSAGAGDNYDYSGTNHRYTFGLMVNTSVGAVKTWGLLRLQMAYYAQTGNDRDGVSMHHAYHYSIAATYQKGRFDIAPGVDVLSGKDPNATANGKFDPLYGTPHKFWGLMDYFYAGTGAPVGGLNNAYLKCKYRANTFSLDMDFHRFDLNQDMKKADGSLVGKHLGTEMDFLLHYNMNQFTNIELGYAVMYASSNMAIAKGQANTDATAATYRKTGNWCYLMLQFAPDFMFNKKVQ